MVTKRSAIGLVLGFLTLVGSVQPVYAGKTTKAVKRSKAVEAAQVVAGLAVLATAIIFLSAIGIIGSKSAEPEKESKNAEKPTIQKKDVQRNKPSLTDIAKAVVLVPVGIAFVIGHMIYRW